MEQIILYGLGNPGQEYTNTKHNIGFIILDYIAHYYKLNFTTVTKLNVQKTEIIINDTKIILAKPLKYMNESGISVRKLNNYYKVIPEKIIILHDDLDLKMYRIKIKYSGFHGGHNGLKSVDTNIGKNYYRIRFGIGRPTISDKQSIIKYVLSDFTKENLQIIYKISDIIAKNLSYLVELEIKKLLLFCTQLNNDINNYNDSAKI